MVSPGSPAAETRRGAGRGHGGVFLNSAGQEQNICPLRSQITPCLFLLLLFQNVQGQKCLPNPLIRKPLSFPRTTPRTLSVPLFLLPQDSLHRAQKEGRFEGGGRGAAASTDAGRKGAFLSLLGSGRDPGWGVAELRLWVKPCTTCGFNLKIQGCKNCSLCKPTSLLTRGDCRKPGELEAGGPHGRKVCCGQ